MIITEEQPNLGPDPVPAGEELGERGPEAGHGEGPAGGLGAAVVPPRLAAPHLQVSTVVYCTLYVTGGCLGTQD